MSMFIDTSALLAVLDADDNSHEISLKVWKNVLSTDEELVTTNYILLETFALVQHRLGMEAVKALQEDIIPVMEVEWVTEAIHKTAVVMLFMAAKRRLSLVDCVSFTVMRQSEINNAFTLDMHFREQGFLTLPQSSLPR